MNILLACLLSIAPAPARAAAEGGPAPQVGIQARSTVQDLVRDILAKGPSASTAEGEVAKDLGIPKGAKAWAMSAPASQSDDGRARKALVFMEPGGRPSKPLCLILFSRKDDAKGKTVERLWLKVSLTGKLEKARLVPGPIEKPSKTEFPDIRSKKTVALFQRELDFWLQGAGIKRP